MSSDVNYVTVSEDEDVLDLLKELKMTTGEATLSIQHFCIQALNILLMTFNLTNLCSGCFS